MAAPTVISSIGEGPRPSREWTIPPRPKPGRKPAQAESESKKAQNRASQRAFRERRQEYVGELEAKVKAYERADGEKSVFYQKAAQKLREENLRLKEENNRLQQQLEEIITSVRRKRDTPSAAEKQSSSRGVKKIKDRMPLLESDSSNKESSNNQTLQKSVKEKSCHGPGDPFRFEQPQHPQPQLISVMQPLKSDYTAITLPSSIDNGEIVPCGFCTKGGSCLCTELANENVNFSVSINDETTSTATTTATTELATRLHNSCSSSQDSPSQPMSIDIKKTTTKKRNAIWPITPVGTLEQQAAQTLASTGTVQQVKVVCNGDPTTCSACANDPFGQAFCTALSSSVCSKNLCASCPRNKQVHPGHIPSMQDLSISKNPDSDSNSGQNMERQLDKEQLGTSEDRKDDRSEKEIPCSDAWRQLKAHPNIGSANLQLLADVVARRTTCERSGQSETEVEDLKMENNDELTEEHLDNGKNVLQNRPCKRTSPLSHAGPHPPQKRLTVERVGVVEALALLDSGLY